MAWGKGSRETTATVGGAAYRGFDVVSGVLGLRAAETGTAWSGFAACRVGTSGFGAAVSAARTCQTMQAVRNAPVWTGGRSDQPASAGVARIKIFSWTSVWNSIGIQYSTIT